MQVDYLIIGQGLCGTFLSWYLDQYNKTYVVIDEDKPFTASKVSSGIINPITGRRFVKTWIIDMLLPFADKAYHEIERSLHINCIKKKNVIHFFGNKEAQDIFYDRLKEDSQYLNEHPSTNNFSNYFNYRNGYGEISPCYLINTSILLNTHRKKLINEKNIYNTHFNIKELKISNHSVTYQNITAEKIIFCDGFAGNSNPFFKNLPYALNKGEFLLVEIKDLPSNYIFKKSNLTIVPWNKDDYSSIGTLAHQQISTSNNIFWVGTSYEWNFNNDQPTQLFREKTIAQLKEFLKIPFEVIDHQASIRSATLERRPFVGLHSTIPQIAILNGMGTKGCSLAPYFAHQLAQYVCFEKPICAEANVNRFKKVLARV